MANFTCRISGLRYSVPGFSSLESPLVQTHPIFHTTLPKLQSYVHDYFQNHLSEEESYLLYLAFWNQTGLVEFYTPAKLCTKTAGIIARNLDNIVSISRNLQHITLDLPRIRIDHETSDLENSPDWIDAWESCFKDHKEHYKTATALERLTRKETTLERYIKDPSKDIVTYAHQLALWASDAGDFPQYDAGLDKSILGGAKMTLAAYWRHIIKACCKVESIWEVEQKDLEELIEHCEDHIPHGSIYAQELMSLLRSGQQKKKNYMDVGDVDVGLNGTVFRILKGDASVEDAAKIALIDSAPKEKPVESHYPNKLAYLKAKMNYNLAQDYAQSDAIRAKIAEAEQIVVETKPADSEESNSSVPQILTPKITPPPIEPLLGAL